MEETAWSPLVGRLLAALGRAEKTFLILAVVWVLLRWAPAPAAAELAVGAGLVATGAWSGARLARRGIRLAIWRLRNRLLVAYGFIAVIPIVLIVVLAGLGARALAGQLAVHLVHTEFERRLTSLRNDAEALIRTPRALRAEALRRTGELIRERFPGSELVLRDGRELRYPEGATLSAPPAGWGDASGVLVKEGLLFSWARLRREGAEVTVLAPLTRRFLSELAPGLGEISLVHFPDPGRTGRRSMRPHDPLPGEAEAGQASVPAAANRMDAEVLWGTPVPVALWEAPATSENALLAVHSRISAVVRMLFSQKAESGILLYLLYGLAIAFLAVELVSVIVGVSITKTMTGAVHDLYEGTERVREGDFTHRIEVHGKDQIGELSQSFNRMTERMEQLLVVAKEKERMQAELEIAREVQRQLFPRTAPALKRLQIQALCNPARMVSGDYYDYQALHESGAALAIGDVSGKGISAALLMATLQSSLRTQIRASLERPGADGLDPLFTASRLVERLNRQLWADTAPEKYATFYFAIYEDASGVLRYTNAGHLPPLLVRRGEVRPLEVTGMVVGLFPAVTYEESRVEMESGDLLVCYTDGITEPENEYGEMYGDQRLAETLLKNEQRDPGAIIAAVLESVEQFTGAGELQDDMTMLVARRL